MVHGHTPYGAITETIPGVTDLPLDRLLVLAKDPLILSSVDTGIPVIGCFPSAVMQ